MIWTAKTRNASGASSEVSIDATSRAAALEELRKRGLTVLSLAENPAGLPSHSADVVRGIQGNFHRGATVTGIVVVALGLLLVWYALPSGDEAEKVSSKVESNRIADVVPAGRAATNAVRKIQKKARVVVTNAAGIPLTPSGKPMWLYKFPDYAKYGITTTSYARANAQLQDKLFKNPVDLQLAYFVITEPGAEVGDGIPLGGFKERFLKAIQTPIVIEPDDSDEARRMKEGVRELRTELKQRLDAGEDIEKVVRETRDQMAQLGRFKMELQKELDKLSRDRNTTEKEMEDFYAAANEMLQKKGAKGVTMPDMLRRRLQTLDRYRADPEGFRRERKANRTQQKAQ